MLLMEPVASIYDNKDDNDSESNDGEENEKFSIHWLISVLMLVTKIGSY